jgi:6-phosphogluconolactonase
MLRVVSGHISMAAAGGGAGTHKLYVGCYTEKQWWVAGAPGEGLYVFDFDARTGGLALAQVEHSITSPSWSRLSPCGGHLYCVTEKGPDDDVADGVIVSYDVGTDGLLTRTGAQPTLGLGSNCVAVSASGRVVVCTNFFSGTLASFAVQGDGTLGPAALTPHPARAEPGPAEGRQTQAHPHDLFVLGDRLLVPDLGLDQVRGWAMVDADGSLRSLPGAQACFDAPAGCGPRGFVQHPGLPDLAYMICELDGSLVTFRLPAAGGEDGLVPLQTHKTYPAEAPGGADGGWPDRWASAIAITPDGGYLYCGNRRQPGDERPGAGDVFTIFRVGADGMLALVGHFDHKATGLHTRNMQVVEGEGAGGTAVLWLVVAHQDNDTLAVYALDCASGAVLGEAATAKVPSAGNVCVRAN